MPEVTETMIAIQAAGTCPSVTRRALRRITGCMLASRVCAPNAIASGMPITTSSARDVND